MLARAQAYTQYEEKTNVMKEKRERDEVDQSLKKNHIVEISEKELT